MNWDDLKIFLDVARQPKLELAASQLQLDATTISRRLRRLESALEVTLFERTRKGHRLTPAGERLAQQVESMESLSLDIVSESAAKQGAAGRVRLGVTEGLGSSIIAPALGRFKTEHKTIDIDLIAATGFVSIPKREADMSILLTRPAAGRLKIRKLSDYSLKLYGTQEYLDQRGMISSRSDLSQQILIGYVDDLIYSSQLRYFDELLPGLTPELCSPSILAQAEMVASGAGLGILPVFMAHKNPALVEILPAEIQVKRTFWLAVHEDVASLARNRLMIDFLVELLSKLP
ncbi:MAG: LysR family transcriptional regulator [Henriciella sp.]